jgi:hypothetical protein
LRCGSALSAPGRWGFRLRYIDFIVRTNGEPR